MKDHDSSVFLIFIPGFTMNSPYVFRLIALFEKLFNRYLWDKEYFIVIGGQSKLATIYLLCTTRVSCIVIQPNVTMPTK